MSNTIVRALATFSDGVTSLAIGDIAEIDSTKATAFIAAGIAEESTDPISPSGSLSSSANGTYDVKTKASAVVKVSIATVTYDVNGGTGTVAAATAIKGNSISLNDGTGITAPEGYTFSGWATTDSAAEPDVESPYTVTADVTLYAVYEAE